MGVIEGIVKRCLGYESEPKINLSDVEGGMQKGGHRARLFIALL